MSEQNSYLDIIRFIASYARFAGYYHFKIPEKRRLNSKLTVTPLNRLIASIQISAILSIVVTCNILLSKYSTEFTIVEFLAFVLVLCGVSVLICNTYIENKYRSRYWYIITGFCDFDAVVSFIYFLTSRNSCENFRFD